MLLEALIAILIFSIGILGIVGMQASAVKASGDARYRTQASLLANQLIGQMWVDDTTPATLLANYSTSQAKYLAWLGDVQNALPGVVANTATAPTVVINTGGSTPIVTITLFWKPPSEAAGAQPHKYVSIAQIRK